MRKERVEPRFQLHMSLRLHKPFISLLNMDVDVDSELLTSHVEETKK